MVDDPRRLATSIAFEVVLERDFGLDRPTRPR
jgi:hypothetical protein